jgi:acyl carrier protein
MEVKILEAIYAAIEELNLQLPQEQRLQASPETVLFGEAGPLDSLGLVNLIVLVEQKVEEHTGVAVALANDEALSLSDSPFQSVDRLTTYIGCLLERSGHG